MNEILTPRCESTFWNSRSKRRSKIQLLCRCLIFLGIISIYIIISLVTSQYPEALTEHEIYIPRSYSHRKVLSISKVATTDDIITNANELPSTTPTTQSTDANCTPPAILQFPSDGFTREQRQHGGIIIHVIISLYCFWTLAIICDDYFLPTIDQICSSLQLQTDVVGATFMAAATSSPGLFMNCVGTFVTKGDIGIGAIVGSSVFNILAVPACCGLFVGQFVRLDWWPVTRDCLMYCVAVVALIVVIFDGKVMWYEALCLFMAYFFYMAVMYYNDQMARSARRLICKYRRKFRKVQRYREVQELTPLMLDSNGVGSSKASVANEAYSTMCDVEKCPDSATNDANSMSSDESDLADNPWRLNGRCIYDYILRWPITFMLWLTIPDCRRHSGCKYVTFLLSIAWIGVISYLVAYAITIIGDTLDIPDSVMGLTILSAGMSVPEAVSSIIVTKQGQGAMGISNAIGSNTFDIMLCLSVPWFVKAYFLPDNSDALWVSLNSTGLTYSVIFLLTALFGLYVAFLANRFVLDWKVGLTCGIMYLFFMVIASLIELNFFFPVNLPVCDH